MTDARILVVDDTPLNLKLARILLEAEGYAVRCVSSAEAALDLLPRFAPRLLLTDIQLPGMDGLEATRRIRESGEHVGLRIVALTAGAMRADEERALAAGCDAWLPKPIDAELLLSTVASLLSPQANTSLLSPRSP